MRKLLITILLRLYEGKKYYKPLSLNEVNSILTMLAKEEGLEKLPEFLAQCATQYQNRYLYTGDLSYRGTVLAFTSLREQILEKRKTSKKKSLTDGGNSGTIKPY